MIKWELLETNDAEMRLKRAKLPGGWLLVVFVPYYESGEFHEKHTTDSMVFFPDPEHQWDGSSVP